MASCVSVVLLLSVIGQCAGQIGLAKLAGLVPGYSLSLKGQPNVLNCTENFIENPVDHFNFASDSHYKQRYFTYIGSNKKPKVIFFYTGNEADVELYVNATGLMWENVEKFDAVLVFAEHRFYGKSIPKVQNTKADYAYLTSRQAIMDYVRLLDRIQEQYSPDGIRLPVIGFGGSYGGMLCAWMRASFPNYLDGCIAASAPVLAFAGAVDPPIDTNKYWEIVTANAKGVPKCIEKVREGFRLLLGMSETTRDRVKLGDVFKLCPKSRALLSANKDVVVTLALYLVMAFDTLAMGNFPYPSSYLSGDSSVLLPAFPVTEACNRVVKEEDLLDSLLDGALTFYNASGGLQCVELPTDNSFDGIWDVQVCSEFLPQETYFKLNGKRDMFFPYMVSQQQVISQCQKNFGLTPRFDFIGKLTKNCFQPFSSRTRGAVTASKIVFSNGDLDPWHFGGVIVENHENEIYTLTVNGGAHHLDLFFSNVEDPPSVKKVRQRELEIISQWIEAAERDTAATRTQRKGGPGFMPGKRVTTT